MDEWGRTMKKRPDIVAATRQALIDAFWTLYAQKRIEKITIKELTQLAHYNRSTFYEHFTDIYDLLEQEEREIISQLEDKIDLKMQAGNMEELLGQITQFYSTNAHRLTLLLHADGGTAFLRRLEKVLYPRFRSLVPPAGRECAPIVYAFGMNGMLMALHAWHRNCPGLSAETFVQLLRSLVEKGVVQTVWPA